ncbi:MAG: hypothetical protein LBV45_02320 [Xanthomonadaceae bacterium]|jgi:hypothetical protein|nr:hypothetical protein [Xanthomonadaceae bacterium]
MQSADQPPETTPPAAPSSAPQQVVHHYYHPQKSTGTAVLLEILPGMFIQTFGIGHLYAGNVTTGLLFMFGYWLLAAINFLLCFIFIGFITWPISWAATMIISVILVSNSIKPTAASTAPPQ